MAPVAIRRKITGYVTPNGTCPFEEWVRTVSDFPTKARILARMIKIGEGSFGDFKMLDDGVYEARIHFGSGWRLYFGITGNSILFLWGGTKGTQGRDIKKARAFWRTYETSQSKESKELNAIH